jgi:hypothetical protein
VSKGIQKVNTVSCLLSCVFLLSCKIDNCLTLTKQGSPFSYFLLLEVNQTLCEEISLKDPLLRREEQRVRLDSVSKSKVKLSL